MTVTPQLGSTIGRGVTIKGDIRSEEDLVIDGQVEGTLDLGQHRLVIGPNAQIRARVAAREVEVQGVVVGNIAAVERIILRQNSNVVGNLKMASVAIEEGTNFKGSIDMAPIQVKTPPVSTVVAEPPALSSTSQGVPR